MLEESPVAQAIREAIDAVAAPDVRSQILQRAQHMARTHTIPPSGDELHHFIEKSLRASMQFYLGEEAASSVMKNLEPIVVLAARLGQDAEEEVSRGEVTRRLGRRPRPSSTDTARPGPADEEGTHKYPTAPANAPGLPLVLIASTSLQRRLEVQASIETAVTVQAATDTVGFVEAIKAAASMSPLVIVDCVHPAVSAQTLSTLCEELAAAASVVLWGGSRDLAELASREEHWLRCGPEASASDVAAIVQMVFGD